MHLRRTRLAIALGGGEVFVESPQRAGRVATRRNWFKWYLDAATPVKPV